MEHDASPSQGPSLLQPKVMNTSQTRFIQWLENVLSSNTVLLRALMAQIVFENASIQIFHHFLIPQWKNKPKSIATMQSSAMHIIYFTNLPFIGWMLPNVPSISAVFRTTAACLLLTIGCLHLPLTKVGRNAAFPYFASFCGTDNPPMLLWVPRVWYGREVVRCWISMQSVCRLIGNTAGHSLTADLLRHY